MECKKQNTSFFKKTEKVAQITYISPINMFQYCSKYFGFKKFPMSAVALRENILKYLNLYTAVWMICKIFSLIIATVFVADK